MTARHGSLLAISIFAFMIGPHGVEAQQAKTPTLQEVLQGLDHNLNRYDKSVPSLFCDEHIVSQMMSVTGDKDITADSLFRLKRVWNMDGTTSLEEQREVKSVNGKQATSDELDAPSLLHGAFEGALAVVSLKQASCMSYSLKPIRKKHPEEPYTVSFRTAITPQNSADCLLQEESQGHVVIDPVSMQITHLELVTPHHTIVQQYSYIAPVIGKRVITADYAPVSLGGDVFWLPTSITQLAISGEGTFHKTAWTFHATYSNYHRLEVTSRLHHAAEPSKP